MAWILLFLLLLTGWEPRWYPYCPEKPPAVRLTPMEAPL